MLSATQGQVPLTAEEKKMFERKLDRVVRWNTLLVHVNINTPDMIKYVFGDRIDVDSLEYDWARNKIMENHRTYKSKTCSQFKLLVNRQVAQDHTLLELSAASFAAKFEKMFNESNYFFCFYFMKFYLNIAGSSALGQWFLKTIFVNLGTRVFSWRKGGETADDW